MKFDKETIIVMAVCFAVLVAWEPFAKKMGWITPAEEITQTEEVTNQQLATPNSPQVNSTEITTSQSPVANNSVDSTANEVFVPENLTPIALENEDIIVKLSSDYSSINSITYKNFNMTGENKKVDDSLIEVKNNYNLDGGMLNFNINPAEIASSKTTASNLTSTSCVIDRLVTLKNGDKFNLTQTFELTSNYLIKSNISITNKNSNSMTMTPQVWAGDLQSWQQLSNDKVRRKEYSFSYYNGALEQVKGDEKDKDFVIPTVNVPWAGVNNKFFALILKANNTQYTPVVKRELIVEKEYIIAFLAQFAPVTIQPDTAHNIPLELYVGPKEAKLLKEVDDSCTQLIKLSWGPLNYLAKGLLWLLIKLKYICGSYGWSIVILTIIVRMLFWPITQKSNDSMKKMQAIKPKVDKLREKYKDNPQLLNTKTMELYREEHINPIGGCLPILLQIPVFFALYATLDGAFVLRQVPFLWASNLAAPDTILSFPLGFTLFGVSNFNLNPLVIAMTLTMILQQRLTPSAMEPMQQKMMTFMPIFMLIFLYDLPSGLTLYWTVSQVFSIVQLIVQQKKNQKNQVAN